uniref:Uncharacterized protein n=1 Tax=Salmonella phage PMBT21 TaxID=3153512 RepID=A0AAU8GMU4_9CAUD
MVCNLLPVLAVFLRFNNKFVIRLALNPAIIYLL